MGWVRQGCVPIFGFHRWIKSSSALQAERVVGMRRRGLNQKLIYVQPVFRAAIFNACDLSLSGKHNSPHTSHASGTWWCLKRVGSWGQSKQGRAGVSFHCTRISGPQRPCKYCTHASPSFLLVLGQNTFQVSKIGSGMGGIVSYPSLLTFLTLFPNQSWKGPPIGCFDDWKTTYMGLCIPCQ